MEPLARMRRHRARYGVLAWGVAWGSSGLRAFVPVQIIRGMTVIQNYPSSAQGSRCMEQLVEVTGDGNALFAQLAILCDGEWRY